MKRSIISSLICAAALVGGNIGSLQADAQVLTLSDLLNTYTKRTPARISVHDPSIFIDSISSTTTYTYYVIGSHLGMGNMSCPTASGQLGDPKANTSVSESSRTFFKNAGGTSVNCADAYGTQVVKKVRDYQGQEVDFPNFDAHAWQYKDFTVKGNQWAPDVVYNPTMKKWLMYMSLNGDHWGSSIVCFAADKPTGPYIYQGPVVCSGFQGTYEHNGFQAADDWKHTDLAIATGYTSLPTRYKVADKWGTYWPNCIDPCVFYDEEGRLLMAYGSWSGGIWMIELDKTTGLRDYTVRYPYQVSRTSVTEGAANANCTSDPYFGKKIAGGWYVSGEGSYIEHIGNYYYLFISYGFYSPEGGYEMRTFRSEKPEGPYLDARGVDAVVTGKYYMNYGASAGGWPGLKLMGSYQWGLMPTAEVAQGHNSAIVDSRGRSFVVYHTKINDGTAYHSVRMHQLFVNQEGWLVAAPYEYHNEMITQQDIDAAESIPNEEIPGNYELLMHNYKLDYAKLSYQKPVNIQLVASESDPYSGTVKGGKIGTWKRTPGTDYIELTLSSVSYKGVLVRQTVDYSNISSLCFTCTSGGKGTLGTTSQQQIWGSKANTKAAIRYTLDNLSIPVKDKMHVTENLTLPTTGKLGATVSWSSSQPTVLTNAGKVYGDGEVTLTLNIAKDGFSYIKEYTLLVGNYTDVDRLKEEKQVPGRAYDLYGKCVQQVSHRIQIIDGKKIVVQ